MDKNQSTQGEKFLASEGQNPNWSLNMEKNVKTERGGDNNL